MLGRVLRLVRERALGWAAVGTAPPGLKFALQATLGAAASHRRAGTRSSFASLALLLGIALGASLAAAGPVKSQDGKLLRCETAALGHGTDEASFRANCGDLKAILLDMFRLTPGLVSECSDRASADLKSMLDLSSEVRTIADQKVNAGLQLIAKYNSDSMEVPLSLVQLVRGYVEMARDYEDALAEGALAVGDGAMARRCLLIADTSYRWVLKSFPDPRHTPVRQRAQVGIDDVRSAK